MTNQPLLDSAPASSPNGSRANLRLPSNTVHVPAVKQATGYSCGAAATLSLLQFWYGDRFADATERDLFGPLDTTPENGTEPEPITAYLREAGLQAEYRHEDVTLAELERAVEAGHPPLVDLQAWRDFEHPWEEVWDAGHYAILVGHDAEHLFFMDPSILTHGAYAYMPKGELAERWHDLAGPENLRLYRMAVFVRGERPLWHPGGDLPGMAMRLG
jgi:predicted double-glycine peptidase